MKTKIIHFADPETHVIEQLNFTPINKIIFYSWDEQKWQQWQMDKDDYRVATFKVTPATEPLEVRLARRFKVTSAKVVKEGDKTFGRFELEIMPKQNHILHLQNHIS